jgi:hypothetical protein
LELIAGIYGQSPENAKQAAAATAAHFGLSEIIGKKAKTLSGGMQRRLSVAMALISEPKILFLDEPTLGMDVLARRELWASIRALKGKITIILTTHYMEEVEALAARIGVRRGKAACSRHREELTAMTGTSKIRDAFIALAGGTNETYLFSSRNATKSCAIRSTFLRAWLLRSCAAAVLRLSFQLPAKRRAPCFPRTETPGVAMFAARYSWRVSACFGKNRTSSFLMRLFTSRCVREFILGYTLPMIVFALAQACLSSASPCCRPAPSVNFCWLAAVIPNTVLFVGIGLLCAV